jgi:NAD(P)-dependent dehydrogenase (short-subunit alcohol dehydrogenase family)
MRARSCVVTGAAMGIGRAIAERLVVDGWQVVGVDRDEASLAATAAATGIRPVTGDIGDDATHERAADAAEALAPLRGWVNNAGIDLQGAAHETSGADLTAALRVLLVGPMLGCAVAVRRFTCSATPGVVVNIGSIQGAVAFPRYFAYGAAKAGVAQLARSIAVDYGHLGIRAVTIVPGAIETPLKLAQLPAGPEREAALAAEGRLATLGRLGQPAEVAGAVAFALSDDASYLTGQSVTVDGGATARCYPYPVG